MESTLQKYMHSRLTCVSYLWKCRCTNKVRIDEDALLEGYDIFECELCSLSVKVHFTVDSEEDE